MMYDEFLTIAGLTDTDVSFREYVEDIEPAYVWLLFDSKQDFCDFYDSVGYGLVAQISNIIEQNKQYEQSNAQLMDMNYDLSMKNTDLQLEVNTLKKKLHDIREIIRR